MTTQQKIYGQFRFPLNNKSSKEFFNEYRDYMVLREDGLQVSGIGAAVATKENIAILMTYDEQSELLLRLKLIGLPDVKHYEYIKI